MDPPTFLIGLGLAGRRWIREKRQARRKILLTVHQGFEVVGYDATGKVQLGQENYYVGITNTSPQRDITVTHVWFATDPPRYVNDPDLPKRLKYDSRWETPVPIGQVPAPPEEAVWLARCKVMHTEKVIESRPREDVPDYGNVPRG